MCNCEKIDLTKIEKFVQEKKGEKGPLIPVLQKTQEVYGYVPKSAMEYISKELNIPESEIYGVVTFYAQFRTTPVGKHIIRVCHGTACHVGGADKVTELFEEHLNIKDGETTDDMNFTLEKVACLGCCSLAPVVTVNEDVFPAVDEKQVKEIIEKYGKK